VPETIFKVLGLIFRGKDMREALNATYALDENPEDLIGWVDENLPREYVDGDLERGFEALSRADVYLGRVRRRQDYGMWRYAGFMEVCGINRARRRRYGGYTKYSPPTYWQKLGRTKAARNLRNSLALKIGRACHVSRREAQSSYIPLIRTLFAREDIAIRLTAELRLEEEEIAFLLGTKKTSKKVGEIYRKSRELIEQEVEQEIDTFAHFGKYKSEKEKAIERAVAEETKPAPEKAEEIAVAPKRRKRRSRDGGEEAEETAAEQVSLEAAPEPAPEAVPETDKKRQRTLFEF
jgi:replication factor C large subunit